MKIKLGLRSRPHDLCCKDLPVYRFHWLPTETLWGFNTREYTWLWFALLITWKTHN